MNAADRVIRWSTALAVVGVAVVAAVVSYEHASALVREHGESGWAGRLILLTVDGLIYASSMVMLDSGEPEDASSGTGAVAARPGHLATLAANVAHGLGHGPIGAAGAAWPAVALVGSYELLMIVIAVLRRHRTARPVAQAFRTRFRSRQQGWCARRPPGCQP